MISRFLSCQPASGKQVFVSLLIVFAATIQLSAQIKYNPSDERKDAGIGVDRVARFFTAGYDSPAALKDDEIRWVQIDLGSDKKITGVKLLPRVTPWGYVSSVGFPSRFKIEVSDDPDFKSSLLYTNYIREDFSDPYDGV